MADIGNKIWRDLFEEFRKCPELWKVKSNIYRNKNLKNKSWLKLLDIYKQIDSRATIATLKCKINKLKTCYRRELNKIILSEKSGAGADELHVPSLWYFEHLDFLRDNEAPVAGIQQSNRIRRVNNYTQDLPQEAISHCDNLKGKNKDEGDVFAESWAISFKKLSSAQQLCAKKAIDEILVLGQLEQLSLNTVPVISPVSSCGNTPYVMSRASTPLPAIPPSIEDSNSQEMSLDESNLDALVSEIFEGLEQYQQ